MTQCDFRAMLLENGIDYVKVVCTQYLDGGYNPEVYFNDDAENYELEELEYVEFEGDIDKAIENYNMHFKIIHDSRFGVEVGISLAQLIEEKVYAYE